MRVLTALGLLMSLALQWPVQIVLDWLLTEPTAPTAAASSTPEEGTHA